MSSIGRQGRMGERRVKVLIGIHQRKLRRWLATTSFEVDDNEI